MGGEVIIFTLMLLILGPIIGFVLGGLFKGVKLATITVFIIVMLLLEPLVVGMIRDFAWKYVPIVILVGAINITLVLGPFYFFKKILDNSRRKTKYSKI